MFLVCASNAQGLSYYSAPRLAQLLGLEPAALSEERRELIGLGLIACQKPLYQLLSLKGEVRDLKSQTPQSSTAGSEPQAIGTIIKSDLSLKAMVESLLQKGGAPK